MREANNTGTIGANRFGPATFIPRLKGICTIAFFALILAPLGISPMLVAQTQKDETRVAMPGLAKPVTLADALRATLEYHPTLLIQRQEVTVAQAQRQVASSQFDSTFGSNFGQQSVTTPLSRLEQSQLPTGIQGAETNQNLTAYGVNITKQFRDGISINTFTNINRNIDNLTNTSGLNTSQTGVQLVFPLLQGRGRNVVAAKERAAAMEVGSRQLDVRSFAEDLLAKTAVSYWNLVAAHENLSVAMDSEGRSKVLLETVNALIEADQRPRIDMYEVKATLASRIADRIAAQQALGQARKQLALDMGLPSTEILTVGDPEDDFPTVSSAIKSIDGEVLQQYIDIALQNRPDAIAAKERITQAKVLLYSAQRLTKPQINFQFSSGYTQLAEGGAFSNFLGSWFSTLHRPDMQTGLVFQFSRGNNLAQGQKLEAQAKSREAELQLSQLHRTITGSVAIAAESVQDSVLRLQNLREAVAAFVSTVEGLREKYRLGEASLTELTTVEDRLNAVRSSYVQAELDYAVALANLRLATGTLLRSTDPLGADASVFSTLPDAGLETKR